MDVKKIKKFVSDNKKELILGIGGCIIGYKFARRNVSKDSIDICKKISKVNRFGQNIGKRPFELDIKQTFKGANYVDCLYDESGRTYKANDFINQVVEYYQNEKNNPEITGMIVFEKH